LKRITELEVIALKTATTSVASVSSAENSGLGESEALASSYAKKDKSEQNVIVVVSVLAAVTLLGVMSLAFYWNYRKNGQVPSKRDILEEENSSSRLLPHAGTHVVENSIIHNI